MFKKSTSQFSSLNNVIVYGSWAYDRVMDYPGRFRDVFLTGKLPVLSLSFTVPKLQESFGGTAGNIAYSLAKLGKKPTVVGSIGSDFASLVASYAVE